jgi:hypothetical protein
MTHKQEHIVGLLQRLAVSLRTGENRHHAEFVSRLAAMLGTDAEYVATLYKLGRVEGMERFALRLLWYAENQTEASEPRSTGPVEDFEIEKLERVLAQVPGLASHEPRRESTLQLRDLSSSIAHFCSSVTALRREAFRDEEFIGVRSATFQALVLDAERIRTGAAAERNGDVEAFGKALRGFLEYVIMHSLMKDVRVVNLIENASLTLQTATETLGADDYDALHQTTLLLEHPATLLEQKRSREEGI